MKLITCNDKKQQPCFGIVFGDRVYSFKELQNYLSFPVPGLDSLMHYLGNVDDGFGQADAVCRELANRAELEALALDDVDQTRFLPSVPRPAALIDFGLSPRHLVNSGRTLLRHEFSWPISSFVGSVALRRFKKTNPEELPYYKGNHNEISGQHDIIPWPMYSSYVDIEPELAFVIGNDQNGKPLIAGYCILNDASARDVQFPEMMSISPGRSKDFTASNGLSPFLVTPDEAGDVMDLAVTVNIGDRICWRGTTAEYSATPSDVIKYLGKVFTLRPGTVIGMGTIPGCCGLDNDMWLRPGEKVTIEFDRLGRLEQSFGVPSALEPSRWRARRDIII